MTELPAALQQPHEVKKSIYSWANSKSGEKAHDFLKVAIGSWASSSPLTQILTFLQLGWHFASLKNTSPTFNNSVCMKEVLN